MESKNLLVEQELESALAAVRRNAGEVPTV